MPRGQGEDPEPDQPKVGSYWLVGGWRQCFVRAGRAVEARSRTAAAATKTHQNPNRNRCRNVFGEYGKDAEQVTFAKCREGRAREAQDCRKSGFVLRHLKRGTLARHLHWSRLAATATTETQFRMRARDGQVRG